MYNIGDTVWATYGYYGGLATKSNTAWCFWFTITSIENGLLYCRERNVFGVNPEKVRLSDRKDIGNHIFIEKVTQDNLKENPKPIQSDGGSSSYYDLKLSKKTIDFIKSNGYVKTEQIIKDVFDNDFDFGNAFKSLIRLFGITKGAGKAGNSAHYESNKIKYSLDKITSSLEDTTNE